MFTAVAPISLSYAWLFYIEGRPEYSSTCLVITSICIYLCVIILHQIGKHSEKIDFKITSVETADHESIAFLLLYLLPLFTATIDALNWQILAPAILLLALVTVSGTGYHFNPLLSLMGLKFYRVGTEEGVSYLLLTQKIIKNKDQRFIVGQLTDYIVIDLKGSK